MTPHCATRVWRGGFYVRLLVSRHLFAELKLGNRDFNRTTTQEIVCCSGCLSGSMPWRFGLGLVLNTVMPPLRDRVCLPMSQISYIHRLGPYHVSKSRNICLDNSRTTSLTIYKYPKVLKVRQRSFFYTLSSIEPTTTPCHQVLTLIN